MKQTYTITTEHDGWTIKEFLKNHLNYSTRHVALLKFTYDFDGITVNGKRQDVRYTLKAGDTLHSVAAKYHTTVAMLMYLNPHIKNADWVPVGTVIRIR